MTASANALCSRTPIALLSFTLQTMSNSSIVYKCYLYGVLGQTGSGGIDLLKAQLFSSESATIFGVPEGALLVLLRTTEGASYGDALSAMMTSLEHDSFPEPWLSKIRYFLRSEIAQRAGRQAWSDLYDRDHFEGRFAIKPFVPATPVPAVVPTPAITVGCKVALTLFRNTLRGVVSGIEGCAYLVQWSSGGGGRYELDDLEFLAPAFKPGDRVILTSRRDIKVGTVLAIDNRGDKGPFCRVAWEQFRPGFISTENPNQLEPAGADDDKLPTFNSGDFVDHVTNPTLRSGIVTLRLESLPQQYKVLWGCFSEEQTHNPRELKPAAITVKL